MSYTLGKQERMKSRTDIQQLFGSGKSLFIHPIKVMYTLKEKNDEQGPSVKAGFAVSKRYFKRANKRNTTKRLMKEAFRLNRDAILTVPPTKELQIFFIFTHHQLPDFNLVNTKMIAVLNKLNKMVGTTHETML